MLQQGVEAGSDLTHGNIIHDIVADIGDEGDDPAYSSDASACGFQDSAGADRGIGDIEYSALGALPPARPHGMQNFDGMRGETSDQAIGQRGIPSGKIARSHEKE